MFEALLGFIHLIIVIWAFLQILGSRAAAFSKLLWCLVVFFLPLVGLIIWFFMGPKKN